ncbi:serine protease 33 [Hetaerina americana]|uniref:serine protease 33 n=1 Tax=Hetaerina americana TaxID=62018 RepID=UPI003A7F13DB
MEAGGGALVAPWWLITARCTPYDVPVKQPTIRRPPPLPDRRHHFVVDNPRPPPQLPNREMEFSLSTSFATLWHLLDFGVAKLVLSTNSILWNAKLFDSFLCKCGIPRLSPRGISYHNDEYAAEDDAATPLDDDFLDDSEDSMGVGEAALAPEDHGGARRLRTDVLSKRIVGGSEARFGEFPWQAHIRIAGYQCGGVLVGRAHVATAAHCVHRARLRDITVFLGEYDTQNTGMYSEPLPGEARRVVKKVIHPEFQYRVTQPDRYDLALLRLSRPVSFRANIIPICLPTAGQDALFRGRLGVVAGWGKTDTSYGKTGTNILHKATVPILKDDECLRWHRSKNIRLQLHSEMFCAGHRDGHSDACLGDSGGPLVVLIGGRWTLAGITSAGFGCAVDHQPGIYHKVAVTANWIAEQVL